MLVRSHSDKDAQDDDNAAHGGGSLLLDLSFQSQVAHGLADLLFLEQTDDALAHNQGEYHCSYAGEHSPH